MHVDGVPLSVYFKSHGEHMTLHTDHEGTPDATLSGTPLSLLRLAGPAPEAALRGGAVHIEGDAEVAQTFSELLKAAQPDLEEELSRVVGDVAAHQIGNAARSALGFARRAHDTFLQNVAEYLQEEGRDVPNRTEAEEFLQRRRRAARRRRPARSAPEAARRKALQSEPGMRPRVLSRLLQIQRVLVRHRLDGIIRATHLFRPLRFAFYLSPATWFRRASDATRGERLRLALEELGPIFMKFGQMLSTRRDLLPRDIADELEKLQDRVPPFSGVEARAHRRARLRAAARARCSRASTSSRSPPRRSRRCMRRSCRTARKSSSRSCGPAFAR